MKHNILKIALVILTLVSFSEAQSLAELKNLLERLDRKIKTVEQLAVRYQNDKAIELVKQARKNFREAISYLQQGKFNRAKMAYVRSLKQAEWAAQIVLYKPAARANQKLNELMRRAERAVNLSGNEDARYMLNKARAFQRKAELAFKQEKYIESQQYYRLSTYFANKVLDMVAIGKRPAVPTDFEQYYKSLMSLYKSIPHYEGNREYEGILRKVRSFMDKARELYEKEDTRQAFMYLQICERMLHRAVDLSQSTTAGRKEQIRANLESLQRYVNGIEQTLGQAENKNAERLLKKANQYLRGAMRDFEKGDYVSAQNKTMLIQRMASKALKYTTTDGSGTSANIRLNARIEEAEKLLQLRREQLGEDRSGSAEYLLDQASKLIEGSRIAYENGKTNESFKKLQLALRLMNQSKSLAKAGSVYDPDNLLKRYNRLSDTLTSLEDQTDIQNDSAVAVLRRLLNKAKENLDSGNLLIAAHLISIVENQMDFILKDAIK